MQRCPNCGIMIAHVDCIATEEHRYIVRLPVDDYEEGDPGYDLETGLVWVKPINESPVPVKSKFICPGCRREITKDEEVIVKLLKGGE